MRQSVWLAQSLFLVLATLSGCVSAQSVSPSADLKGARAPSLDGLHHRPHPRTLDVASLSGRAAMPAAAKAVEPLPVEPEGHGGPGGASLVQKITFAEEERILRLALAGLASGNSNLIGEAKRRALHIAGWRPEGATGFHQHDQGARTVAWTLALVFDWLHGQLSEAERARLLAAIRPRVENMLAPPVTDRPTGWAGLDWGRKLDRWPYDSHGAVTLARLAVICTVLGGEDPLFDRCFEAVVPRYLARPIPWGGEEGGYANGTAYAQWDVLYTHFVVWDLLKHALGVNLWHSAWAQGYGRYIAYFLPPGTPTGMFGDETETRYQDVWATQAKAYAARIPSPLADWYARNQFGEKPAHLALLLAPPRDWSAMPGRLPAGTPHAVHLEDIGWVAMHSDLGDRARTSVYFKSSPFGSYNHSHADQNAFVIHAQGHALAIDSGYYDSYGSAHWKDWYKQTLAHNAITFDGGQGQLHDTMAAKGKVTRFEHHADYDFVTGDATAAYGGALTRAVRSIVYLRPDTVLVYDSLASATPRTWEWNLHALSRMKERGPRELEIKQNGVRMCVKLLDAPEGALLQTDQFTTPPQGKYPVQWHSRYASAENSLQARFLVLIEVGCHGARIDAINRRDGIELKTAARRVIFDDSHGVEVTR